MNAFLFAFNGPRIYRIPADSTSESINYQANILEAITTILLDAGGSVYSILKWTLLLWGPWFSRNVKTIDDLLGYAKMAFYGSLIYLLILILRATGRLYNADYSEFMSLYESARLAPNEETQEKLTRYSFTQSWPALFDVRSFPASMQHRPRDIRSPRSTNMSVFSWLFGRIFASTIGIRMAYPGCTGILNSLTLSARLEARDRLRLMYGIKRIGINTREGEFVEGFYADRRNGSRESERSKGSVLIVCCEGNGGYPEIGIPLVPLQLGYSVLAWNHPGFGASTGMPFPTQEHNAVEAVILFAVHYLKFSYSDIYLYGWSIGGYSASWAAANFPKTGGLILDATFDDLDELSKRTLPEFLSPFVLATVKEFLDLDVVANVVAYDGPVRVIRRAMDEVICTSEPPSRSSNRGNFLLLKLLKHRFPNLMNSETELRLNRYLSLDAAEQESFVEQADVNPKQHESYIVNHLISEAALAQAGRTNPGEQGSSLFPSQLGLDHADSQTKFRMLMFLVSKYFVEAPGTHCAPLSPSVFELPWSPDETRSTDTF